MLSSLCDTATGLSVVIQEMSWRKAQDHCRLNNSDLASVMSPTENLALQNTITSNNPPPALVWIGLFKDQWEWSDQSGSSFRDWEPSQPNNDGVCCLYDSVRKKWFDRGCSSSYPFYCYGGEHVTHIHLLLLCPVSVQYTFTSVQQAGCKLDGDLLFLLH